MSGENLNRSGTKLAVLGGKGFVGSAVAAEARARAYDLHVIDLEEYDGAVGSSFDILVNANGNSKKYLAAKEPAREFDLSVGSVMRSLQDFTTGLYVHLSSIDVYPDHSNPAHNAENAIVDSQQLSPYGLHKYLAERLVQFYADRWLLIRMGGFVGAGLWKNSIHDMLTGKPLRVHPDSEYQYLNTRDLAQIVLDLVEHGAQQQVFNVAGDGTLRLRDAAAWIPGYDLAMCPGDLPVERYEVNVTKIMQLMPLPATRATVKAFMDDVQAGRETVS